MSAVTTNTETGVLQEIAARAAEARQHLLEAITGLNKIIELASQQGRDDIVKEAQTQRQAAVGAAETFDQEVGGKRVSELDPDKIDQVDESAKTSLREMHTLYKELERRVNEHSVDLQNHSDEIQAIKDVLPQDDEGNLVNVTEFVDGRIAKALKGFREGARQTVNDAVGREVWTEDRPLRTSYAFWAFGVIAVLLFLVRWYNMGFWASLGWPLVVVPGVIAIGVLLWDNRSSRSHSTTAPAVREEGH